jgi:hypothetical protein
MPPEILNRIDEMVLFRRLGPSELEQIVRPWSCPPPDRCSSRAFVVRRPGVFDHSPSVSG